jgi:hypothetical protein
MVRMGILEYEEDIISEEEQDDGIIEVQLGNAQQIFNPLNDYYLFGIVDAENENNTKMTLGYLEVYTSPDKKFLKKRMFGKWFDLTLGEYEYFPAKGPPGIE